MKRLGSLVLSAALLLSGAACGDQRAREVSFPKGVSAGLFAMDTYLSLTAYGEKAEGTLEQAQERIRELESLWSVTDEHSEIYAANHSGGEAVAVSEDTAHLVRPPGAAWCRPPLSARKANGVTPSLPPSLSWDWMTPSNTGGNTRTLRWSCWRRIGRFM